MIPASQGLEVVVVDDGVRVPAIIDTEGLAFPYRQEAHAAPGLWDWRRRIQPQTLDQRSTFQSFNDLIIGRGRWRIEYMLGCLGSVREDPRFRWDGLRLV
jgi:hypothetical protein